MEKNYSLNGHNLVVLFEEKLIRIKSPTDIQKFLAEDINIRSEIFVNQIKNDYYLNFKKELEIQNDSLIIEIWAHAFASYFAKALKNLIHLKLIEDISDYIIKRSDTIDCGENEVDSNRNFWDLLANFKQIILTFLPKKLK